MISTDFFNESISQYRSRLKKRKDIFEYAKSVSKEELVFNIQKAFNSEARFDAFRTAVTLTNSSVWLSRSAFKYLKSFFDLRMFENQNKHNVNYESIINAIVKGKRLNLPDDEIFKTIYHEMTYSHLHSEYKSKLLLPKTDITIVLISGVFNEIFSTPAFKRGAEKLLDEYHIKHFAPVVDGTKGSKRNAALIKNQINEYIKDHPKEKLWFIAFSKGGVDTLHFLKNEGESISKNIVGVSLFATPILGSDHLNHKILRLINVLTKIPEDISTKIVGKRVDLFAKELQRSLSKSYRENWFKKNHRHLPRNIFYSAVAFESKWHQSHIWMMFTKAFFRSQKSNDGIVDVENAQFPNYFDGLNLGVLEGHHLIGSRSSFYDQEALIKSHLIFFNYKKFF